MLRFINRHRLTIANLICFGMIATSFFLPTDMAVAVVLAAVASTLPSFVTW